MDCGIDGPGTNLLELLELEELPLDEGVVVGVHGRRDERAPPVHLQGYLAHKKQPPPRNLQ